MNWPAKRQIGFLTKNNAEKGIDEHAQMCVNRFGKNPGL